MRCRLSLATRRRVVGLAEAQKRQELRAARRAPKTGYRRPPFSLSAPAVCASARAVVGLDKARLLGLLPHHDVHRLPRYDG